MAECPPKTIPTNDSCQFVETESAEKMPKGKASAIIHQVMELQEDLEGQNKQIEELKKVLKDMVENNRYSNMVIMPTFNLENVQVGNDNQLNVTKQSDEEVVALVRKLVDRLTSSLDDNIQEKTRWEAKYKEAMIKLNEIQDEVRHCKSILESSGMGHVESQNHLTEMVTSLCSDRTDEAVLRECVFAVKEMFKDGRTVKDIGIFNHNANQGVTRLVNKFGETHTWPQFALELKVQPGHVSTNAGNQLNKETCLQLLQQFIRGSPGCSTDELANELLAVVHTIDNKLLAEQRNKNQRNTIENTWKTATKDKKCLNLPETGISGDNFSSNDSQVMRIDILEELVKLKEMVANSDKWKKECMKELKDLTKLIGYVSRDWTQGLMIRECVTTLREMVTNNQVVFDLGKVPVSVRQTVILLAIKLAGKSFTVREFASRLGLQPEQVFLDDDVLCDKLNSDACLRTLVKFVKESLEKSDLDLAYDINKVLYAQSIK